MTANDLKNLVEKLDESSSLYQECASILPELDDTASVQLHPRNHHVTTNLASVYRRRFRRLSSSNITNYGVGLAADFFSLNIGRPVRSLLVETHQFKGYAFTDHELKNLLVFAYVARVDHRNT